jgi:hypothetical protein
MKRCIKFDLREQTNNNNNDSRERELMRITAVLKIIMTTITAILWILGLFRSHVISFVNSKDGKHEDAFGS